MIYIDADKVHQTLDYSSLVENLYESHKVDIKAASTTIFEKPTPSGQKSYFLSSAAWQKDEAIGAKLVTVFPDNERNYNGLPTVQAVYILFDGETGKPSACIDGTALTLRKTAADSALGTRLLANPNPEKMLMIGAGALAPHLIAAHCAVRNTISEIKIWNRTPERARNVIDQVTVSGLKINTTEDLQGALEQADLVSCATMATTPLVKGPFLKSGAHLDLVGSYRSDMMECDENTMSRGSIFTDSPWSAVEDSGEIICALNSGAIKRSDILGNLFDLCKGHHSGRIREDEITVFKNGGGGHLDLMVARYLVSQIEGE